MILFQTGELFQGISVGKSRNSIKALMKIKPDYATVIRNGEELRVSPEEVEKDEIILVLPGEKVPLDGVIETKWKPLTTVCMSGSPPKISRKFSFFSITSPRSSDSGTAV